MTSNPVVRKLAFTGSTEVGKTLMAQCAGTVKKVTMELGGNAPFIVFDDADVEAAIDGAMASKYRNMGQTCVCANRILVQDCVYDDFAARLSQAVSGLKVANGFAPGAEQGPLIDMAAVEKVEEHIADATAKGARVVVGGKRHALGGTFFEPTILADVTPEMTIAREETFGPVARCSASTPRTKPWRWPTTPRPASPPTSTAATSGACGGSRKPWSTASSASTPASSRPRWRPSAA